MKNNKVTRVIGGFHGGNDVVRGLPPWSIRDNERRTKNELGLYMTCGGGLIQTIVYQNSNEDKKSMKSKKIIEVLIKAI